MPLSEYQRIYDGFEHAGLRVVLDAEGCRDPRRVEAVVVDTGTGQTVGQLTRYLHERDGELYHHQEIQRLDEPYHGRGFTKAMIAHTTPRVIALGVRAMTITAHNVGGLVWGRMGWEFDLYGVEGSTDEERIARSVAAIFDPDVPRPGERRRFLPWHRRLPNANDALSRLERGRGDRARAAAAMRARIPTAEAIAAGRLEGTFTHPDQMVAFESHGIAVGVEVMRWARWKGIRWLDRPGD